MISLSFSFNLNPDNNLPKYRQLVDSVKYAISEKRLNIGDTLPSVNQVCKENNLSRDTVFKAYSLLKEQGVIEAIPNKGYYVTSNLGRVFFFLDTFKAYKEVLYGAFKKNLPDNLMVDMQFHHYNISIFRKLIEDSIGKYSSYIIMPFDNNEIPGIIELLPKDKTLIIDWDIHSRNGDNVLNQDFTSALSENLVSVLHLIRKYRKFIFLYPEFTFHPRCIISDFENFCKKNKIDYAVETQADSFSLKADHAYVSVSDRMLGRFLEQSRERKLEPGKDVGIISYNETPMKKFIYKGITVISTDFKMLGKKAAEFAAGNKKMKFRVPTKITIRESI